MRAASRHSKRMIGGKRALPGKTRLIVVGALVDDQLLAKLLVVQRVDIGLGILLEQDLADAEHGRILAVADDADGELAAGQIGLDQHRLVVARKQLRRGGGKLLR